jgi:murein DD-endopeptidase MepM/ murein hydrolase activator NlpD
MANKLTVEIVVSDNGTAKIVQKGIEGVGNAAESTTKKTRAAGKAQDEFNYKLNQGATGVSSAARSFSKLNQAIGEGPNGLVGAYATLAANAFAVSAAFNVLKNASQVEQLLAGLEAQGARTGKTLTGLAGDLKDITGAAISSADAMRAVAQASTSGIKGDDIRRLTEVATASAMALGRDVPDSLNRLILAVTKAEPELVDELGLTIKLTEAFDMYARQTGKTADGLSRLEKQQALVNAWASQGEVKFGALADAVDPNPYAQLAASFSDLTNTLLNFINSIGLSSFVSFLANDKLALTAAVLLFVSTIKDQLLPVFTEASKAAKDFAEGRVSALQGEKTALDNSQKSILKHKKANEDLLKSLGDPDTLPKFYGQWVKAERDTTAATVEHDKALKSLTSSEARYRSLSEKAKKAGDIEGSDKYKALEQERAKDIQNLKGYAAQKEAIESGLKAQELASAGLGTKIKIEESLISAQASRADAIEALSKGELRASISSLMVSTRAYNQQLIQQIVLKAELTGVTDLAAVAHNAEASALVRLRVAAFGAATAIKAVGSAVLTALPWIGLIVLAIDLLWEALQFVIPDSWKKQWEAFDKLEESVGNTTKKIEEYNKILSTSGDISQKSLAALTNRTNTLSEAIDAYDEYNKAIKASQETQLSTEQQQERSLKYLITGVIPGLDLAMMAWDAWADSTNQELGIPLNSLTNKLMQIGPTSSQAAKSAASMLAVFEKTLPNTVKNFAEVNKNFEGMNEEARNSAIQEFAERIEPVMRGARDSVDELSGSLTELSSTWSDFIRSISPTTPYDKLTSSIDSTLSSIAKFKSNVTNGVINQEDVNTLIQQVNEASSALPSAILGGGGLELRDTIQETDNALVKLRERQKGLAQDSTGYLNLQEQISSLENSRVGLATRLGTIVGDNLTTLQDQAHTSQLDNITLQSSITLAQARLSLIQRQGKISVQDVRNEIAAKNRVVDLQVQQLRANRAYLEMEHDKKLLELEAATRRAEELRDLASRNQKELEFYEILLKGSKIRFQLQPQTSAVVSQIADIDRQLAILGDSGTQKENLESAAAEAERRVTAARRAEQLAAAAIAANDAAVAAANMGRVTAAEETYQVRQQILQIDQENWNLQKRLNDANLESYTLSRNILDIKNQGIGSESRQFEILKEQARVRREDEQKRFDFEKRSLEIERDKASAEGRTDAANILQNRINLLNQARTLEVANSKTQEEVSILSKIDLDTGQKKLELLQKSLEVLQKEADLRQTTLEKEQELLTLRLRNSVGGRELGEVAQRAVAYRAAQEQLKLAKEQARLRRQGIIAEYALLEAQRVLLEDQLRARQVEAQLLAATSTDANTRDAAQRISEVLTESINNLSAVSYNALRENALRIADLDIQILEERATLAYNQIIGGFLEETLGKNNPAWKMGKAIEDSAMVLEQIKAGKSAQEAAANIDPRTRATVSSIEGTTAAVENAAQGITRLNETAGRIERAITATNAENPASPQGPAAAPQSPAAPQNTEAAVASALTRLPAFRSAFGMTSGFGTRERPKRRASREHAGVDYAYPEGTPLTAQLPGVVRFSGAMGGFGNVVDVYVGEMENGTKIFRRFAHMMDTAVTAGERVNADTRLGRTGNTGTSTGAHLHQGTYMEDKTGRTTAMSPDWRPMMRGYGDTNSSEPNDDQIVVTGQVSKRAMQDIAQGWSDSVKMARAEVAAGGESIQLSFIESLAAVSPIISQMNEQLRTLGPQGELVASINEGMMTVSTSIATMVESLRTGFAEGYTKYIEDAAKKLEETGDLNVESMAKLQTQGEFTAGKLAVAFSAAAAAIGAVSQILNASSQARMANIDKEISAEQKRDGQSAASVARIDAMEKKKDSIARKAFNTNKKLMMAQAVMSTAAGIAGVLAHSITYGPILTPVLAGLIGAMGLAQIAIISGTQYESSYSPKSVTTPSSLSIGKTGDSVNLAGGPNANAGGEVGYLRGAQGTGTNASNYNRVGSAYGGDLMRGYGNRGFIVGEKGPEVINPETPISVTPANDVNSAQPINASFSIQALDASDVKKVLVDNRGNIIQMLREAANNSGQGFMEDVNVNVYTRPNIGKL